MLLSITMFAVFAVTAAFVGCAKDKPDVVVKDNDIKLVKPDVDASFDLSEVAKITFLWTEAESVDKYTLKLSSTEAGLATTAFTLNARVNTSYDLPSAAADVLIGAYTTASYEEEVELYWTVTGDTNVPTQIRRINVKRLPEGTRLEVLGEKDIVFDAIPAGPETVEVVSNVEWFVKSSESWLTVNPTSGEGGGIGTFTITAAINDDEVNDRTATVTVSVSGLPDVTIEVTQTASNYSLDVTGNKDVVFAADPSGGQTFNVVSNTNWEITTSAGWLTVEPASGSGDGTFAVVAAKNSGAERVGTVTVKGAGVNEPVIVNITQLIATVGGTLVPVPDPVYFNNFERGLEGSTIVGAGSLADFGGNYGTVFQNATGGRRTNYLQLPEDALSHSSETLELSVSVWVNASQAGGSDAYGWSPLFTAYGGPPSPTNTWPMFALQYRGVAQINCAGWTDFTDDLNVNGVNTLYHFATDWLSDGGWHLYTATFTEYTAKIYFDGLLVNEWIVSGEGNNNVIKGLFTDGHELTHICLGGNQAWDWGDNDPGFMFDNISIFNRALTAEQIGILYQQKK